MRSVLIVGSVVVCCVACPGEILVRNAPRRLWVSSPPPISADATAQALQQERAACIALADVFGSARGLDQARCARHMPPARKMAKPAIGIIRRMTSARRALCGCPRSSKAILSRWLGKRRPVKCGFMELVARCTGAEAATPSRSAVAPVAVPV